MQKQPTRGFPKKSCSENMQHIYKKTPMLKYDFNKVALKLYWNHTSAWVFSCKSCCIFSEHLFLRTYLEDCFCWCYLIDDLTFLHPKLCVGTHYGKFLNNSQENRRPITRKQNLKFYQFWGISTFRISSLNPTFWWITSYCIIAVHKGGRDCWVCRLNLTKSAKCEPLLTMPSHSAFVLRNYGQTNKTIESNQSISASQTLLTNRYQWIDFIQLKHWFSSDNF